MSNLVRVIRLDAPELECRICECPVTAGAGGFSIPMYEDLVVPNDWKEEWGGFPACAACYEAQLDMRYPMTVEQFKAYRGLKGARGELRQWLESLEYEQHEALQFGGWVPMDDADEHPISLGLVRRLLKESESGG